jgi:hypothetical protein
MRKESKEIYETHIDTQGYIGFLGYTGIHGDARVYTGINMETRGYKYFGKRDMYLKTVNINPETCKIPETKNIVPCRPARVPN